MPLQAAAQLGKPQLMKHLLSHCMWLGVAPAASKATAVAAAHMSSKAAGATLLASACCEKPSAPGLMGGSRKFLLACPAEHPAITLDSPVQQSEKLVQAWLVGKFVGARKMLEHEKSRGFLHAGLRSDRQAKLPHMRALHAQKAQHFE